MSPHPINTNFPNSEDALSSTVFSVQLELHGTTWRGSISQLTEKNMLVSVEGFMPVTNSQKVTCRISLKHSSLEIPGKIHSVRVEGSKSEFGGDHLGNMSLQLTWPQLDEFTSFRLKTWLSSNEYDRGITHIALNFVDDQIGNELVETSSILSHSGKDHPELPELAKASDARLISTLFQCPNSTEHTLVGYIDEPEDVRVEAPVVVLTPGYGETKREYITLAYYLASNGFRVVRYDHTHHVGESDGVHEHTSLNNMKRDMQAILNFASTQWKDSKKALVATSLAGRVALKALSELQQVDQLILISGIVDVRATLAAVHQEDLIGDYLEGQGRGVTNVLGFNVDGKIFLKDTVEGGYSELNTTIEDARNLTLPVTWFSAEHDAWVDQESYQQVINAFPLQQCRSFIIPEGLHRLQENPRKARAVYRQIVFACQDQLAWYLQSGELNEPSRKDIGRQNRMERERNQTRRFQHEADHVDFWSHYLSNFHYIANSHDYLAALDHIYHLLGHVKPGDRLLDAGCGNGHFGSFLFAKEWTQHQHSRKTQHDPIHYVGVDFVNMALSHAQSHLSKVLQQAEAGRSSSTRPSQVLSPNFSRLDLNQPLPFKDGSFDRIMSNLVIGYLRDPRATIRELYRVLAPGGTMVLTNLKPSSDLTQIYRNFVDRTTATSAIDEAREVLNNSSHIRQGESEGAFQFYTQEEFHQVLMSCGVENPSVYPTFGNQAFVGVIQKSEQQETNMPVFSWASETLAAA